MHPGLVSPEFVGRGAELAGLLAAHESALAGDPAAVLVGGEAGVGKSRLVEEAAERARTSGTRVLTGSCIELGGEGLPLSPFVDALRSLMREMEPDELDAVLGPARLELARLLPELDPRSTGVLPPGAEEGNVRLLEFAFGVIQRLALERPLMLVIEDLNWADRSTFDLVELLVRALRSVRVLLVLTFRTDEIHRTHPLRSLVTGWERVRSVRRIELARFTREETACQLEAILGTSPTRQMVDLLHERSEGNPYLVEEILGAVQAGASPAELPVTLRDVLLVRAERLSPQTLHVLRIAAVAGRSVPDQLLARVADLAEPELDAALREAVEHHLLVVDEATHGYRFRHALTRDAVYSDALPRERVRIHAAYAQALSEDPALAGTEAGAATAAALAVHYSAAHDLPRALAASVDAARESGGYAPAEALSHLERALELWPGVPDAAERCGMDVVELSRLAAVSAYSSGKLERAVALYDEALGELRADAFPERVARLLVGQAAALQDLGRFEDARAMLERAASLLPAGTPTVARAEVLVSVAGQFMIGGWPGAWQSAAEEALEAARAANAREQEAMARIIVGAALCYGGKGDRGVAEFRAGLEAARELGDHALTLRGYLNLSDSLEMLGRHEEAVQAATTGLELAAQTGLSHHVYARYLVLNCAEPLIALGRWAEADRMLSDALDSGLSGMAVRGALAMLRATVAIRAGRYDDAERDLNGAASAMQAEAETFQEQLPYAHARAVLALVQGRVSEARKLISDALVAQGEQFAARYAWPLIWLGLRIEAEAATVEPERLTALSTQTSRLQAASPTTLAYQALAAAEEARATGTPADWPAAVEATRRAREPYLLAYALLRAAGQACNCADRDGATEMLEESIECSARIGAAPLLSEARELARRARLKLSRADAAERPDAGTFESFGLTERELEVLALVAVGRSNPQIAAELFISPKTASVHVSNIIGKLNVSSRGEAAALAHRLGIDAVAPAQI
jgi:DNA-binding NarL/FixJ family response regulator